MRTVAQGISLRRSLRGEFLDIIDLEGEVGQIRTHDHRAAFIELAQLDFLVALGGLEEDELRAASAGAPAGFLEAEHVLVETHGFVQILHAIAGVKQFLDHAEEMVCDGPVRSGRLGAV